MYQQKVGSSFLSSSFSSPGSIITTGSSGYGLSSSTGMAQQQQQQQHFTLSPTSTFRPKKPQSAAQTTFVCIVCLKDRPMSSAVMLKSCVDHYYICRTVHFYLFFIYIYISFYFVLFYYFVKIVLIS